MNACLITLSLRGIVWRFIWHYLEWRALAADCFKCFRNRSVLSPRFVLFGFGALRVMRMVLLNPTLDQFNASLVAQDVIPERRKHRTEIRQLLLGDVDPWDLTVLVRHYSSFLFAYRADDKRGGGFHPAARQGLLS